ncbi:PLP-dependent aminotransferase family protein [Brevibacterium aurantiacum]|uniref:GntR family transcriptional regulator n=1 Tax=Brevibacterium aurantiacum TaxID=273384 RepID=A0A3Q9NTN1_BREAU|nr:PLP-dependent aminotransferase family protein [Brevibacterium aurantiacum]AZT94769.1 GntR family transcriptional regulator [Brevibacterium aurantiacum]
MIGSDFLNLDPATAPPRGRTAWLTQQLRTAITDGTLAPGTRLPASRVLAGELSVARGTVVEAYRRLGEEGLLVTNHGGGTEVTALAATSASLPNPEPDEPTPKELLNISAGVPDLSGFPRAAWLRAERRVLTTATAAELGYADPQGTPRLRTALANWLARSRGITAGPEQIIVTAGVTGALSLLAQVLRDQGITDCAIEDPGADGNRRILDYWLDTLHPIPVDSAGLDVTALARTDARAVLVTPAHQFPTGVVLAPDRRRELLAWAEARGGLVVEDDYDSEYRYDRTPVRALHAAAPERVVHISSLSKVLAPALRIGWMIAPTDLHDDLVRKRWATDLGSPALPQLALADLIDSGTLERHLRSLRLRHRERRDAAVAAIRRYLLGCRIEGVAAGLHLLVRLPEHVDDTMLAARAEEAGFAVQPLSAHRISPGPPGLIIGYGPHPPPRLEAALQTLGAIGRFTPA